MTEPNPLAVSGARRLNHVEFAHRPGEDGLVIDLFEALGCPCDLIDTPPYGKYIVVRLDDTPHGENDMFVSQAEPEQLALEDRLQALKASDSALAQASALFRSLQRDRPYRTTHIGMRLPSVATFDAVVANLNLLIAGKLARRLELGEPTLRNKAEAEAMSAPVKQLWLWTDVISTGLLNAGQQIELQTYQT